MNFIDIVYVSSQAVIECTRKSKTQHAVMSLWYRMLLMLRNNSQNLGKTLSLIILGTRVQKCCT